MCLTTQHILKRAYFFFLYLKSHRSFPILPTNNTTFIKRNLVPIFSSQPHPRFLGSSNRIPSFTSRKLSTFFTRLYNCPITQWNQTPFFLESAVSSRSSYTTKLSSLSLSPFLVSSLVTSVVVERGSFLPSIHRSPPVKPRFSPRGTFSEGGDWRNGNEWNAAAAVAAAMIVSRGESGTSLRSLLLARNQRCGQPG